MNFSWEGLVRRHPYQIMDNVFLSTGCKYVFGCASRVSGITGTIYRYLGRFEDRSCAQIQYSIGSHGFGDVLGFTLHKNGWYGNARNKLDYPTMVEWKRTRFLNYSHYGFNFGLKRILSSQSFEAKHRIVVPLNKWDQDPYIKCDYDSSETPKIKSPNCRYCKGTGVITLLTSDVSCECVER